MSLAWSPALAGSLGSLLAGLATGLGALPILGIGRSAHRYQGMMLGFAAGAKVSVIMSQIVPDLDRRSAGPSQLALILGLCLMMVLDIALA
ncbi:MAG: hypothetical protein AABZ73_01355 [Pseudomonadota bacterium]|uniref:hypothetical protein n=1 Tax=Sphingobium sp. TaxID=1912891 RepID=UPI002E22EC90